MTTTINIPSNLPVCPETGLFIQSYVTDFYTDWQPELPEGWVEFDDRLSDEPRDFRYLKRCESVRVRRIGPRAKVLARGLDYAEVTCRTCRKALSPSLRDAGRCYCSAECARWRHG